jgi:hypothetical protein
MSAKKSSCVILVPALSPIVGKCEEGLQKLEKQGYRVRRVRGFSAVDQGRNLMASEALRDGFDETMWIDTDIGFEPEAVEKLRSHKQPIVAGLYPQPAARSLACELMPGTDKVIFGEDGGLIEIKYAAAGFLYVRREAYEKIRDQLKLPLCNTRFGKGVWPFFQAHAVEDDSPTSKVRHRYLTEDFAFCHRARLVGLKIMADTSVRLWRVGAYGFGWEDAGAEPERFDTYHFNVE